MNNVHVSTCLIIAMLLFNAAVLSAQKRGLALIDSLKTELDKSAEDTSRVMLLGKLGDETGPINLKEGIKYTDQAMALARKLNWEKGTAYATEVTGRNEWRQGKFAEALKHHFEALSIWQKLGNRKKIATLNLYIAQDYGDDGNYFEALKYLSVAMEGFKKIGDKRNQSMVHAISAWVYGNLGLYPESLKHDYASLKIFEEIGDKHGYAIESASIAETLEGQGDYQEAINTYEKSAKLMNEFSDFYNEAVYYSNIGRCYTRMGEYTKALIYHQRAFETGKKIHKSSRMAAAYSGMGDVYIAQDKFGEALKKLLPAAELYKEAANKPELVRLYIKIADCYVRLGNLSQAKQFFEEANALNKSLESIREKSNYYENIVKYDSASGHWKDAFEHYKLFILSRDSLYNEENTKKMVQTRMQYEFDKKEAAAKAEQEKKDAEVMQELEQQKLMRNGFMVGFSVVVLFAGVFFHQRNTIKKGKQRSDELLLNILPAEVAEELKTKGSADAKLIDEVTVLLSDFKDFTQLSENLTPKELVAEINHCFSAFDLIMQKNGVEKIKTVGDAYLAAGGLPVPNNTHAVNVLNAALEMQAFIQKRQRQREAAGQFFFEARIGIHTGPVVAGIVGIKKFAYDIWGDTVNTTQRLESSSEAGKVNISESTYLLVKDQFKCQFRGMISAKGKGEVGMYYVIGEEVVGTPGEAES